MYYVYIFVKFVYYNLYKHHLIIIRISFIMSAAIEFCSIRDVIINMLIVWLVFVCVCVCVCVVFVWICVLGL